MRVIPLEPTHLEAAAGLFCANLRTLRQRAPALPERLANQAEAVETLAGFLKPDNALVALDGQQLVGYLGWWTVPGWRGTPLTGAYCPVFGHSAAPNQEARVYRALYAAAAELWAQAGCQIHGLTLMAGDTQAERFWFENGFGMLLHDAIRQVTPIHAAAPHGVRVRQADARDAPSLALLDAEHCRYYSQPPVFMAPRAGESAPALVDFMAQEPNSIWLAEADGGPQAFLRFQAISDGAAWIVRSPETIAITGAFTRPAYRGKGLVPALLDAALKEYGARGFTRMSVDYETLNPAALVFWPRYFEPVAVSLVRVVEYLPD